MAAATFRSTVLPVGQYDVREGDRDDEQLRQRTELELPAITAWARAELTGYSDADLAAVVDEWSRSLRTRRELYWLEGALARRHR